MNNKIQKNKIKITDSNGQSNFHVLCTFESSKNKKNYVLYTDYSKNEIGNLNIFSATYEKDLNSSELLPVTEKDEIQLVDRVISELQNSILNS